MRFSADKRQCKKVANKNWINELEEHRSFKCWKVRLQHFESISADILEWPDINTKP